MFIHSKPTLLTLASLCVFALASCKSESDGMDPGTGTGAKTQSSDDWSIPASDGDSGGTDTGTIERSAGGSDRGNVDLRTPAHIVASPTVIDFGIQSANSQTHRLITLQNTGQKSALNLRTSALSAPFGFRSGNYPGFRGTCGAALEGGAICTIQLTYSPNSLSRTTTNFNILYDGATSGISVPLILDGTATNISTLRFDNLLDDNPQSDFGNLAFGTVIQKTIHVTFYGTRPATGVTFSGVMSPFSIASNTCGSSVSSDCDLVVSFTSSAASNFLQRLKVTYNNTSYTAEDNHDLLASGSTQIVPATLSIATASIPRTLIGSSSDATLSVVKGGTLAATSVSGAAFGNNAFSFKGGSFPGAGGTCTNSITSHCTIVVTFNPATAVTISDTVRLNFFDGTSAVSSTQSIAGQGANPALLTLNPSISVSYGSVPLNKPITRTWTLSNPSTSVAASSIALSGITAPFSWVSGCVGSLSPGAACTLTLRFQPTAGGNFSSVVNVSYFDGVTTQTGLTTSVSGTGTLGGAISFSVASYDFGNVIVGQSKTGTVTLNYYGGNPATLTNLSGVTGVFSFTGGAFPGTGGTCGMTIAASCTLKINFAPLSVQLYTTPFSVDYDDGLGGTLNASMNLRGTGIGANPAVLAANAVNFGSINTGNSASISIAVIRTGNFSATTISPFGLSVPITFLGGSYPGTGGTCGTTLSGGSCTLILQFTPITAGLISRTLNLSYFDGIQTQTLAVSITGTGVNRASLAFAGLFDFGSLPISQTTSHTLTLTNSGTSSASLALSVNTPFSIGGSTCGAALSPAESCSLAVDFAPASPGNYSLVLAAQYVDEVGAGNHSVTLTGKGTVAPMVSANGNHTCARNDMGQLKCWGQNNYGQLGLGDFTNRGVAAGEMGANLPAVNLGTNRWVKSIHLGYWHTCAILDNDSLKCFGNNLYGQLGMGSPSSTLGGRSSEMGDNLPVVNLGSGATPISIAAGYSHNCALLSDASVKCWGQNNEGQLGYGDTHSRGTSNADMGNNLPTVDLAGNTAIQVVSNTSHSCALLSDHSIKCWGNNFYGQLGLGDFANRGDESGEMGNHLPAIDLGMGHTALSVVAGGAFTCAVLENNTVKCWGRNENGILGVAYCQDIDGNVGRCSNSSYPLAVRGYGIAAGQMGSALGTIDLGTGRTASALYAANSSVCAVLDNGSYKCWGRNQYGQLGLGDSRDRGLLDTDLGNNLSALSYGTGVTPMAFASGNYHSCLLFTNNSLKCWGDNRYGGLGLGDIENRGDDLNEMGNSLSSVSY